MHAAIITPRENLFNFSHLTRFDMVVPDHFTGSYERNNMQKALVAAHRGHYIILDNGTYERGQALSGNELLVLSQAIKASEIVVPDHWKDRHHTHETVHDFFDAYGQGLTFSQLKFMLVPQGRDLQDWITGLYDLQHSIHSVYDQHNLSPSRFVWGVPKWLAEHTNRIELVDMLPENFTFSRARYPYKYHLLGLSKVTELMHYGSSGTRSIRSIDTSLPVKAAVLGQSFLDKNPAMHGTEFIDSTMSSEQFTEACHNVVQVLSVVPEFEQHRESGL